MPVTESATPHHCLLGLVASYRIYADVRLHHPMTHIITPGTEGPVRQKYKGNPNNPKPFFEPIGYGVRTFTHVSILLACTFLLLKGSTYERGDAAGAGVVGLILLSCIGRMWDNNPGEVEKAFALATTLLPVMVGFLAVQPFNRFVDVV